VLLRIRDNINVAGMVMEYRSLEATYNKTVIPLESHKVYCDELQMYRIYPQCSIHTATGRLTIHSPNLQSILRDKVLDAGTWTLFSYLFIY